MSGTAFDRIDMSSTKSICFALSLLDAPHSSDLFIILSKYGNAHTHTHTQMSIQPQCVIRRHDWFRHSDHADSSKRGFLRTLHIPWIWINVDPGNGHCKFTSGIKFSAQLFEHRKSSNANDNIHTYCFWYS